MNNLLPHYVLALTATSLSMIPIAAFVYFSDRKKLANKTFGAYFLSIGWWAAFEAVGINVNNHDVALFWWRFNHIGVIFIPVFLVHFVYSMLRPAEQPRYRRAVKAAYTFGFFFLALNATPYLIVDVVPKFSFNYFINPGPMYYIFLALWLMLAVYGMRMLFHIYFHSRGEERQRLTLFSWFMGLSYLGGVPNFLPTFNIEIPYLMPFGTYALPVLFFVTAYSIVRHQLMDIEVVIKRTVVFAGLTIGVLVVVGLVSFVLPGQLLRYFGVQIDPAWLNLISVTIVVASFNRTRSFLVDVTNQYLFQKSSDYKELLKRFTDQVLGIVDIRQLIQMTVLTLTETMKIQNCGLWMKEDGESGLNLEAHRGLFIATQTLKSSSALMSYLRERPQTIGLDSEVGGKTLPENVKSELKEIDARLCVPLAMQDEFIGLLTFGSKKSDEDFFQEDVDVLQPFGRTLAMAISNARMFGELARKEFEATTDELTGLLVRRAFLQSAGRALSRSLQVGEPCSLLMVDLDHFKQKNDTYGHLVGDEVLRETSLRTARMLRGADIIGRYGGEEFILFLPTSKKTHAMEAAERIRQNITGTPISTKEGEIAQTVSIGVATAPDDATALQDLIDRADKALYTAKRSGRNRAMAYEKD